jgi:hypothetical protein
MRGNYGPCEGAGAPFTHAWTDDLGDKICPVSQ